jgi:hypothetical protein
LEDIQDCRIFPTAPIVKLNGQKTIYSLKRGSMSTPEEDVVSSLSSMRLMRITVLAWLAITSVDFFLNAGLLARLYRWDLPGFLAPVKMLQYIPLGYAAFLFWSTLLVWLMKRLSISGLTQGAAFGLRVGVLSAAAGFCGEVSIFALPVWMLFVWAIVNTVSFTIGGAVVGAGLASPNLRKLTRRIFTLLLLCLVFGVVLQNIGDNPAKKLIPGRVGFNWDENR